MASANIEDQFELYAQVSSIPPDIQQSLLNIAQFGCYPDQVRQWYINVRQHFGAGPIQFEQEAGEYLDDILDAAEMQNVAIDPQRRILEWLSPIDDCDWLLEPTQLTTIMEAEEPPRAQTKRRMTDESNGRSDSTGTDELLWTSAPLPKRVRHTALPKSKGAGNTHRRPAQVHSMLPTSRQ